MNSENIFIKNLFEFIVTSVDIHINWIKLKEEFLFNCFQTNFISKRLRQLTTDIK